MKKLILPIFFCLFIFAGQAWAFNFANFTIQNPGFSENYKFYIDIYAVSTDDDFQLGDTDLRIQFNNLVLSNPVPSEQNSSFHSNSDYGAMSVGVTGGIYVQFQITASGSTGTVLPDTEVRLARITFDINPATYDTETAGIDSIFGTSTVLTAGGDIVLFQFTGAYDGSLDCMPSIDGTPATSIVAGNSYSFTPTSSGGCDPVTFSIQNQPSWASFSTSTGALTGTATPAATYSDIIITVVDSDGDEEDLAAFDIVVTASCQAPTISGTPENFAKVGSSYSFTPTVSNGCTPLVISGTNIPGWATFDSGTGATGALTGIPASANVGTYSGIEITVTDNNSNADSLTAFSIEVCEATTISGTPATSVVAGQAYSFTPTYSGCGDPTFDIENMPSWASFDTNTGALTGTPAAGDVGTDSDIVISVLDETDDQATLATFDIEVTAASSGGGGGSSGGGGCFLSTIQP